MSQIGTTLSPPSARSRLAQIIGFPASPEASTSKSSPAHSQDDEWYIPYNGPIEPPRRDRGRPRGNTFGGAVRDEESQNQYVDGRWDATDDTFGGYKGMEMRVGRARAVSNATVGTRKSYASSSTGTHAPAAARPTTGGGGCGIGEAPVHSAASTYSGRERTSDSDWERERDQRGSIASFLTFGQGARRSVQRPSVGTAYPSSGLLPTPVRHGLSPVEGAFVYPVRGRRSEDSAEVHVYAMPSHVHRGRQRSGTADSVLSTARGRTSRAGQGEGPVGRVGQGTHPYARAEEGWYHRDREREQEGSDGEEDAREQNNSYSRARALSHSTSHPVLPRPPQPQPQPQQQPQPQRHPYAVAFPGARDPPHASTKPSPPHQGRHLAPPPPPSHFSTASTASHHPRLPTTTISPAAIAAALHTHTHTAQPTAAKLVRRGLLPPAATVLRPASSIKASFSSPNLRALFGMGAPDPAAAKGGDKAAGVKPPKTQYAAETWCDALMFPRPRFRAHVVSPPASPTDLDLEGKSVWVMPRDQGPMSAPLEPGGNAQGEDAPMLRRAVTAAAATARAHSPPPPPRSRSPPPPPPPPQQAYLTIDPHPTLKAAPTAVAAAAVPALSPVEETLQRVIAEGTQRDREREMWNEVARTSFQNRRSRSLSRTRTRKNTVRVRARVESDAGPEQVKVKALEGGGGTNMKLGHSLTVGLTTLAAEAFSQPTPTISTTSTSTTDSHGHSRNTSTSVGHAQGQGHARNTSWVALKKLCAPEGSVFSDAAASPQEEKLEGALMHEKTARVRVKGRREEAEEADVQFVDIAPQQAKEPQRAKVEDDPARSHSHTSHTSDSLDVPAVGIALSTPPILSSNEGNLPDLSAHPYAQPSTPRLRAGPVPISAAYTGPHLAARDYNKHRLPPHAAVSDVKPPEKRMYAALQSGAVRQVSTPEIAQSPVPVTWDRAPGAYAYAGNTSGAYAYANVDANDKRESTLGVEEALMSRAFQRGGAGGSAEDSGFGSLSDHDPPPQQQPREPSPPPAPVPLHVRRKHQALNPYSGIPSLSHTVTTAPTDLPEPESVQEVIRDSLPSPSSVGSGSTQTSPRPLGSMDDLEPFRDLFYKPGRRGSESTHRTPSSEIRRTLGSREPSSGGEDARRITSSEGLSGLRKLTRQLSEESVFPPEFDRGEPESRRRRLGGLQEEGHSPSLPGLNDESLQLGTPLSAEFEESQDFPEDIQSSRASSVIEHESIEETLRVGSLPVAVPEPMQSERRQSTALSFGETEDDASARPNRDTVNTATSSLGIPVTVEDLVRTSFVTSTSSTSRMSNLIGDFPRPPVADGATPPSAAILDSYFIPSEPSPSLPGFRQPSRSRASTAQGSGK